MLERKRKLNNFSLEQNVSSMRKRIVRSFCRRYQFEKPEFNVKQINDIVFNERVLIVAMFKDFLIMDDNSEFLKRFYSRPETKERLPKIFEFYEINSKIFPNYIILSESRYIYKNIQRKQKLIDQLQEIELLENEKKVGGIDKPYDDKVINTEECNSIMNQTQSIYNFKSTKNNSLNNSSNSIELLVNKIEKADVKAVGPGSRIIQIKRKDSQVTENKMSKGSATENVKPTHPKLASYDSQAMKIDILKKKENLRKKFFIFNEKNNNPSKTPDKLLLIENAQKEFKEKKDLTNKMTKAENSVPSSATNDSKINSKSRNQPTTIDSAKSNPKTFDNKSAKTPEKTFQKKNSELSIPKFTLSSNVFNSNFMAKNLVKSESKNPKPQSSKQLSESKDVVPFKIKINLDNTDGKVIMKNDFLSSRKFTRNLRSKISEQNNSTKGTILQLSSMNNNPFRTVNKMSSEKANGKQTIEASSLMSSQIRQEETTTKSRNVLKSQLTHQESSKNQTGTNLAMTNMFLSNANPKVMNVNRNLVLQQAQSSQSDKKNHTPDFIKINKFIGNSKSPINRTEDTKPKIVKKCSDRNTNSVLTSEKLKLRGVIGSSVSPSIPNSARVDNYLDKQHFKI